MKRSIRNWLVVVLVCGLIILPLSGALAAPKKWNPGKGSKLYETPQFNLEEHESEVDAQEQEDVEEEALPVDFVILNNEEAAEYQEVVELLKAKEGYWVIGEDADTAVVLISAGEKRTGGYSIEVDGADLIGEDLVIDITVNSPAEDDMVTQALTYPYVLVQVANVFEDVVVLAGDEELDEIDVDNEDDVDDIDEDEDEDDLEDIPMGLIKNPTPPGLAIALRNVPEHVKEKMQNKIARLQVKRQLTVAKSISKNLGLSLEEAKELCAQYQDDPQGLIDYVRSQQREHQDDLADVIEEVEEEEQEAIEAALELEEHIAELEEEVADEPNDIRTRYRLATLLRKAGRTEEALALLEEINDESQDRTKEELEELVREQQYQREQIYRSITGVVSNLEVVVASLQEQADETNEEFGLITESLAAISEALKNLFATETN